MHRRPHLLSFALLLAGWLAQGCSSAPKLPEGVTPTEALAVAEQLIVDGESQAAIELSLAARAAENLSPELRTKAEATLDRAVDSRLAVLEADPDGSDLLLDLLDEDLPRFVHARVAVAAASHLLADGERLDCYETLRDLDRADAGHPMRGAAASLLAEAGFSFADDPGRYFFGLFRYSNLAQRVLEHLVINYPGHPDCPRAYEWLAAWYEEDRQWSNAIQRGEELILYHPESPRAPLAALHVAELRMTRLQRDDYDRGGLLRARDEFRAWLQRYPDHELTGRAVERLAQCQARLATNDFSVAAFYAEVDKPFGARLHAERALIDAEAAGDADAIATIREFLAALPEPGSPGGGPPGPGTLEFEQGGAPSEEPPPGT